MVLINEKITRLSVVTERLDQEQRRVVERLVRLETIIDLAREAARQQRLGVSGPRSVR
jgi:hypothetical protein